MSSRKASHSGEEQPPPFVKSLDQLTAADSVRVGGKAYNCARLRQAGFPVPDGVAVMTGAIESSAASAELDDWLMRLPRDTLLAVRSSAVGEDSAGHSFAGIHETKLNVSRDGVADAVRACRASVGSPQAVAYRRMQGLPTEHIRTGVLVQRMIQPVISGVAFTINPITGARDEIVISASWGLGEAVVMGQTDPDEFHVRKSDGVVLSSHIGDKRYRVMSEQGVSRLVETEERERAEPSLDGERLRELAGMLVQIEQHYQAPQDIEWCHDGTQFWIVQSRPVTTSPGRSDPELEWTRANLREVLPDLTSPQALAEVCHILNQSGREYYGKLLAPEPELGPTAKEFYGRLYFNLSQFRHICQITGNAPAPMLRGLGHEGNIKPDDEVALRPPLCDFLRALPDWLRIVGVQLRAGKLMRQNFARILRDIAYLTAGDLQTLSDAEVWAVIQRWRASTPEYLQMVLAMSGVMIYDRALERICKRVGFSYEQLVHTHLAIGKKSVSAQQGFDLLALANQARGEERAREYFTLGSESFKSYREDLRGTRFLQQFDGFLRMYGHRGIYESDWALPRYRDDPTPLLFAIATHVRAPECPTPEAIVRRQNREAAAVWKAFEAKLNWWQRVTLVPRVRWLLRRAKQMYLWREGYRSELVRLGFALRRWNRALAGRFAERGWIEEQDDYFFLKFNEVAAAARDEKRAAVFRAIVTQRRADLAGWRHLEMPLVMRESELPKLVRRAAAPLPDADVRQLNGLCVSAGCAEGEVLVMRAPSEFARMKRGAILVAPATDPSWTPLFTLASGVIVEVGGMLSHASTVAREYGLPALANLKDATKLLRDGDYVRLDATNGSVRVLRRVPARQP